jgi:hypothetical protein
MKPIRYFTRSFFLFLGLALCYLPQVAMAQCAAGETFNSYCYTFGEVNTVAFEYCPNAGEKAEADITQGTFDPFFPNTLTVYQGASGSGTAGTILFGPTGGTSMGTFNDVSGNTVTSTAADDCLIFVINTVPVPGFDCATGSFLAVEACGRSLPAATVSFTAPADLCIDAGLQAGLGGGAPTGGVYSGSGVTDDGNGMTYTFDPAAAGAGAITITYTTGAGMASDDVEVFALPTFTALNDLCVDAGVQTGLSGGSPAGGTYSGPGVTDNNGTYTFNPGIAGVGVHTITYTSAAGCVTSDDVEVLAACGCPSGQTSHFYCYDNFELDNVAFEVCPTDPAMAVQASIQSGMFEDIMGPQPDDDLTVYEGASGSGTMGTQVFGPQTGDVSGNTIMGSGAGNCLIFVVNSDGAISCQDGFISEGLSVCGQDIMPSSVVNFTASVQNVCIDGGTVTVSGGTPTGGVYSGPGVTDDGNGMTFTFDPPVAGGGLATVTYTNGGSATDDINVIVLNVSMSDPGQTFCPDDNTPQFFSGLGTPSGAGGVYSGAGVTDLGDGVNFLFTPSAAGAGMIPVTYTYTDGNGCSGSDVFNFDVAFPNVAFTALADLCIDAGVQAGLGGGTPTGGTYSGPGVTDDGNGMTYSFDPAAAGVGTHTITYTFTDGNSCGNSTSDDVEVFGLPNVNFTALADICIDAGVQAGLGGGTPTGGVYSGPGVTDDGNGMTYSFDPATAGVGVHTITYDFTDTNGCSGSASDDVEVFALPVVLFNIPAAQDTFCIDAGVQLIGGGTPGGGVYSGPGVTDNGNGVNFSFDPTAAGLGLHILTYTFTDANGCVRDDTDFILVGPLPPVGFTAPADLCIDAGMQAGLGGGTPAGGVYSGPGVTDDGNGMTYRFDPAAAGVSTHTITYTFVNTFTGCSNSASEEVEVFGLPNVSFTAPADLCIDAGVQAGLGGGTPIGGVYSGTGVTDDGNGMTYSFDPAVVGIGIHTITYDFTDGNGCSNSASDDVEVLDLPTVNFTALSDLCVDAGVQIGLGGGTPTDGVYSGPGVTDDGNGMTYSFDPAAAGVGTHSVTYSFTDGNGCSSSASDDVEVFGLPMVAFSALGLPDLCVDAGVQAGLSGGAPAGGVYSGPGVTDDGNGMTYSFDPSAAGVGAHVITYTFMDGNSCSDNSNDIVVVFGLPSVALDVALGDVCFNAGVQTGLGGGTPTGGIYSGAGVTDDGNGMTFTFDPATAGLGAATVTYTFTDGNGCSDSATDNINVTNDVNAPMITGTLPVLSAEGCGVGDAPAALTTVAALEMSGLMVSDDCSSDAAIMVVASDVGSGSCPLVVTRTYTLTDETGKSSTVTQTINIEDITPPTALCQSTTVELTAEGTATLDAQALDNGSSDNCSAVTFSASPNSFDCNTIGANSVTLTVADECGNTNTCSTSVTVEVGNATPSEWTSTDIGNTVTTGSFEFDPCTGADPENGEFTASGGGANLPNSPSDDIAFLHQTLCGDGYVTVKIESVPPNGYAGLTIRESLAPGARQLSVFSNTTNILLVESRTVTNGPKTVQLMSRPFPTWLRMQRQGPWVFAYYSTNGVNFQYLYAVFMPLPNCVEVGLAVFPTFSPPAEVVVSNLSVNSGMPTLLNEGSTTALGALTAMENLSVKVFPNPASDQFHLQLEAPMPAPLAVALYNSIGQMVAQRRVEAGQLVLDWPVHDLPAGMYYLRAQGAGYDQLLERIVIGR